MIHLSWNGNGWSASVSLAVVSSRCKRGRLRSSQSRDARRLRRVFGFIVKNAVAVVAGNYFVSAPHVGHDLRPQRHEASRTSAIARLGHGNTIADACADPVVQRAHLFRQFLYQAFTLSALFCQLFLLSRHLLVELHETRLHVLT